MLVEICLPVKDEEKILERNLEEIIEFCQKAGFNFSWKIIGVINGSTDKTARIFKDFKNKYPQFIDYVENPLPGRGQALKKYWLSSQADIVSYLDIDLAVLPAQLPDLIMPIIKNNYDLVIGSRLSASSKIRRSILRETTSRVFNFLSRLVLPNKVSDLQCGFKAVRLDVFKKLAPLIEDDFWFFDTELVVFAQHFNYRIKELPVNWVESRDIRRVSKVRVFRDVLKSFKNILKIRKKLKDVFIMF